jgi:tetratricopeptide (TPR) repeat protein
MIMRNMKACVGIALLAMIFILAGCSSTREPATPDTSGTSVPQVSKDRNKEEALRHFVDGSIFDSKGEYASAVLEYQDALRSDPDPAIYHALAKDYAQIGKFALAAEKAREAVRLDPASIPYRETLAEIHTRAFEIDSAVAQYEGILRVDSNYVNGLYNLARLYQAQRKPLQSLNLYGRLLDILGNDWDVLVHMVELYGMMNNNEKVAETLRQLLTIDPGNVDLKKRLAEVYLRLSKYDEALHLYDDVLELNPRDVATQAEIGNVYVQKKEWDKAAKQYDPIIQNDSVDVKVKIQLAEAYFGQIQQGSKVDTSLLLLTKGLFEKIRAKHPDEWRPYMFLGAIADLGGDDSTATKYLEKATQMEKSQGLIWLQLGRLYLQQNKAEKAVTALEKAQKLSPNDFDVNLLLGVSYNRANKFEEAARVLQVAKDVKPNDAGVYLNLGEAELGMKNEAAAADYFGKATQLGGSDAGIWAEVGRLYVVKEKLDKAIPALEKSREMSPENFGVLMMLGFAYSRLGENEKAVKVIDNAIRINPKSVDAQGQLALIYDSMHRYDLSDSIYGEALKMDPHNHLLLNNFSYSLSERGVQLERALDMATEATKQDTANSSYLDTIGWIYFKLGKYAEAERYIKKAVGLRDATGQNGATLNEHLGDVYFKMGNNEKAIECWNKALKMDATNKGLREKIDRGTI